MCPSFRFQKKKEVQLSQELFLRQLLDTRTFNFIFIYFFHVPIVFQCRLVFLLYFCYSRSSSAFQEKREDVMICSSCVTVLA